MASRSHRPARTLTAPVMGEQQRWLVRLRWLAAGGLLLLAVAGRWLFDLPVPVGWIGVLAAFVAAYNGLLWRWLRRHERAAPAPEARGDLRIVTNVQISLDLLVLAVLLHLTGGVTNPLAVLMAFHVVIASILLPRRDAFCQATWASILYVGLAVGEALVPSLHRPLVGYMLDAPEPTAGIASRPLFVTGECGVLVATFFLIVFFTSAIADRFDTVYRQLTEANEELAKLEQTKSHFLHIAGHQIRTPLAALHSMMDAMLETGAGFTADQRRMLHRARHRAGGMLELINEMLTLSAVKENLQAAEARREADVSDVLDSIISLYADFARAAGVQLTSDTDCPARVVTWGSALQDVFGNMISNAVKYTPSGGRVDVACEQKGRRVIVTVADTGIGIPSTAQGELFAEFYRAPNARTVAEGTGLGLSIVKEIVDRLGGRVTLCSDESSGTIVQVELPRA